MTTNLNLTTTLYNDYYLVEVEIDTNSGFPKDIFMYENTGAGLGEYQGVCTLGEFKRLVTFQEIPIPIFGNKILKYVKGSVKVPLDNDVSAIRDKIIKDVKTFKLALESEGSSTQSVPL